MSRNLMHRTLSSEPVEIYGIDPATDFTIRPWLQKPLDRTLGTGEVIIGNAISAEKTSQISLAGHTYSVAGRLDPTQSSIDHTVFLGLDDAYTLAAAEGTMAKSDPPINRGDISAVMVQIAPGADPGAISSRIRQPSTAITVIQRHFALDPTSHDVSGIPSLLNMISAVVIAATLPLIAIISAMVSFERQQEIGLFMSMGAKRNVVFSLVIAESLILAAIGGIAGIGTSLAILFLLNAQGFLTSVLQVSFRMPSAAGISMITAVSLCVVIAIGSIASLWPAYRSSTMNPYDAIRGEG